MSVFDIFKKIKEKSTIKKENIETVILQKKDRYTKLIIYYELKINLDSKMLTTKILKDKPYNSSIYEFDEYVDNSIFQDDIYRSINNCEKNLKDKSFNNLNYFLMEDLYDLKDIEENELVKNSYNKYQELKDKLILKCNNLNIDVEYSEQELFNRIVDEIEKESIIFGRKYGFDYETTNDFEICKKREDITNELRNQLNGECNKDKFSYAKKYLINYYGLYIIYFPHLLEILNKNKLNDNERNIVKRYTELFNILPSFINKIDYLEYCEGIIEKTRNKQENEKLEQNKKFIDDLVSLFSKTDIQYEDLYIHATTSESNARSIVNKGLYIYSDNLDDFSYPYQNFSQLFRYQYDGGSSLTQAKDYIVVFRMPKDDLNLVTLKKEEQKEALSITDVRRNTNLIMMPTKMVSSNNILGIVDKKKMIVLHNDKFISRYYNNKFAK